MADEQTNQAEAIIGSSKPRVKKPGSGSGGILWVGVLAAVVALCALCGFYIGSTIKSAEASQPESSGATAAAVADTSPSDNAVGFHYFDMDSITVNLNEPRLDRFVKAIITLAFEPKYDAEVRAQVKKRMPELKNWLTVYLAGRTLDEVRGEESLNRIRREICEAFNQQIWPNQPPRIHHVLFKEFAVQ